MDVTTLRIGATIACFITFVAIMGWTFLRANRKGFDEAAMLPFADSAPPTRNEDAKAARS
jgi:cytochrome c oxidase cbb3-type subunit 4